MDLPRLAWSQDGVECSARWRSESGQPPPRRVVSADDRMGADAAYRLVCAGTGLLWRGDFQNARQLLQALGRRAERSTVKARDRVRALAGAASRPDAISANTGSRDQTGAVAQQAQAFHLHRQAQSQRARTLGLLLLHFTPDHSLALRRAPDVRSACAAAWGPGSPDAEPYVASMRELLGLVSAHEWRSRGVAVPALGARIHPHYGVFAPLRGEYLTLVAQTALPAAVLQPQGVAWDIGTGSGVLAALLVQRGVQRVVATDCEPRALECAGDNLQRLGLSGAVQLLQADLFPSGAAALIVCNPPWIPARPSAPIEQAVYDPESRMLRGFLAGLRSHLGPGGEGWLVLSDLAEHLGLRSRAELLAWIGAGGMRVLGRTEVKPEHRKALDPEDPLHSARGAERTSLWRLGPS